MIQRIQCVANIYDHSENAANIRVRVQYFNLNSNRWINLTPIVSLKASSMQYTNTSIKTIKSLTNEHLPVFRLVNFNKASEVISCGYSIQKRRVARQNHDELYLDFGTIYYHSSDYLSEQKLDLPPNQHGFRTVLAPSNQVNTKKQAALIQSFQRRIRELETTNTGLTNDLERLEKQLADAKSDLKNEKSNSDNANKERNKLEKNIQVLEGKVKDIKDLKAAKDQLLKEAERALIKARSDLKNENSRRVKAEEARQEAASNLEQLKEEMRVSKKNGPANISAIYRHMIEEVEESMPKSKGSRFSIGKVSMNLKGLVVNDNGRERFQLLDPELAKQIRSDVISNVFIEINDTNPSEDHHSFVPNVIGQTETAVRNTLKASDLHLNAIYQSTKSAPVGQAFKQSPVEGESLPANAVVTVVFSK